MYILSLLIIVIISFWFGKSYQKDKTREENNSTISETELKYFASFQCNDLTSCKKGALCNSCWIRNWAIDKLKLLRKTF